MTQTLQTCKRLVSYWPVGILIISVVLLLWNPLLSIVFGIVGWYYTFSGAVGSVQVIGRVYFILKKDHRWLSFGQGTMHELSRPWRKGTGLYVTFLKWSLQIGVCHPQRLTDEQGTLSAVQGRYLETSPKEIGQW